MTYVFVNRYFAYIYLYKKNAFSLLYFVLRSPNTALNNLIGWRQRKVGLSWRRYISKYIYNEYTDIYCYTSEIVSYSFAPNWIYICFILQFSEYLKNYFHINTYPTIIILDKNKTIRYENFVPYEILKEERF